MSTFGVGAWTECAILKGRDTIVSCTELLAGQLYYIAGKYENNLVRLCIYRGVSLFWGVSQKSWDLLIGKVEFRCTPPIAGFAYQTLRLSFFCFFFLQQVLDARWSLRILHIFLASFFFSFHLSPGKPVYILSFQTTTPRPFQIAKPWLLLTLPCPIN